MTRRSRPQASADARRRSLDGDPLSEAIDAFMRQRQAAQLPAPHRRGRMPRRKRGSGWPTPAITALAILTVASLVVFLIV